MFIQVRSAARSLDTYHFHMVKVRVWIWNFILIVILNLETTTHGRKNSLKKINSAGESNVSSMYSQVASNTNVSAYSLTLIRMFFNYTLSLFSTT